MSSTSGEGPVTRQRAIIDRPLRLSADDRRRLLEERAKTRLGVTDNVARAGFILRDGTMINMSSSYRSDPSMFYVYHDSINKVYDEAIPKNDAYSDIFRDATSAFIEDTGAVRIYANPSYDRRRPNSINVEMHSKATPEQWAVIKRAYDETKKLTGGRVSLAYDFIPVGGRSPEISRLIEYSRDSDLEDLRWEVEHRY